MTAYWMTSDSWTLTRRTLLHWRNQPGQLVLGLLFPVMVLLMFAYLFGGAMAVPGGGDYREFPLPGMFALTMAFGLENTYTAVAADAQRGVTDRFRTMPISAAAVVTGRSVADMLSAAVGLAALIGVGLAVGFLSSVFAAPETVPGRLGTIAEWNPLPATANATRELFGNPGLSGGRTWLAIAWPILLLTVFVPLASRRYRRLT